MKSSVSGFAAQAVALAAALGLSLGGSHRAGAAPTAPTAPIAQNDSGPNVTILSPAPHAVFTGVKPVEISAFYESSSTNQIVTLELYVDGIKAAQKILDAPESRGVVSFLVDASALTGGSHRIVVRATAADAEVASATGGFSFEIPTVEQPAPAQPSDTPSQGAPTLSIENPAVGGQVQGKVTLRIQAQDPSGKPPYVSLFIDHGFKTLRNYAPYEFTWDTTDYANGYHTIEAFGYNDAQDVGHAQPLRVFVNNPGGRTDRRTDLKDAPQSVKHDNLAPTAANLKPHQTSTLAAVKAPTLAKGVAAPHQPSSPLSTRTSAGAGKKIAGKPQPPLSKLPALSDANVPAGQTSLHDPFIADTATAQAKKVTPTRGLKPMPMPTQAAAPGAASLPVSPAKVSKLAPAQPLRRMAKALPPESSSLRVMQSPTSPAMDTKVQTMMARPPAPKVSVKTVRVSMPDALRARHYGLHAGHMAGFAVRLDWLHAAGQSALMFNSSRLPLERPLAARGSVLFGPLRRIFQSDGGSLTWQARGGVVTGRTPDRSISLTIGQEKALVNQKPVLLDGVPYINSGRTMIPVSFLQEALNATVKYDQATGHLLITSNK